MLRTHGSMDPRHSARRPSRPVSCSGLLLGVWVAVWVGLGGGSCVRSAGAQTLSNSATGASGNAALDATSATITLNRTLVAAPPSVAEISPNLVDAGSPGNLFTVDILPDLTPASPAVARLTITPPAGYLNVTVVGVRVNGADLELARSAPAAGQCRVSMQGAAIVVELGDPLVTAPAQLQVQLTADAPAAPGPGTFACALEAPGGVTASRRRQRRR